MAAPPFTIPSGLIVTVTIASITDIGYFTYSGTFYPIRPSDAGGASFKTSNAAFFVAFLVFIDSFVGPALLYGHPTMSVVAASTLLTATRLGMSGTARTKSTPVFYLVAKASALSPRVAGYSATTTQGMSTTPGCASLPTFLG